jgi:hypothetical protein
VIPAYVQERAQEFADIRLRWPRTAIVDVLPPTGFVTGGLIAEYNRALYPVLARVLVTHECREVKPGDVVRFTAMNFEDAETYDGRTFAVMYEKCMMAVIEGFDEAAVMLTENVEAA